MWGKRSQRDYKNTLIKYLHAGRFYEAYNLAKKFYTEPFVFDDDDKILIAAALRMGEVRDQLFIAERLEQDALRGNQNFIWYAYAEYRIVLAVCYTGRCEYDKAVEALKVAKLHLSPAQRKPFKKALKLLAVNKDYAFIVDVLKLDW